MPETRRIMVRLRFLGVVMLILGLATVWVAYRDHRAVNDQRDCLRTSFSDLTDALQARAVYANQRNDLATQKDNVIEAKIDAQGELIHSVPQVVTQEEFAKLFTQYDQADQRLSGELANINMKIDEVTKKQSATPVPPFPAGRCD